ncbi:MAG: hypothetical protein ABI806_16295 [Candidatus Solibacter sp.]
MTWKRTVLGLAAVAAVIALVSLAGPRRAFADAVSAVLMRDADLPARQPFQAAVIVSLNNFRNQEVRIPAGKRLVVEYVTIAGGTCCTNTQPLILLNASLNGAAATTFYLQPVQSEVAQNQFYKSEMMRVYADQLSVGFGWSGGAPSQLVSNVAISGHLIDISTEE